MADDSETKPMELYEFFEMEVREKTGGLLATNQSVTDPHGAFHCACTNSNVAPAALRTHILEMLAELEGDGTEAEAEGEEEEDTTYVASVSADIHVMRNGAPSNLKTHFSAKVIGIESPEMEKESAEAFLRTLRDAAAWAGVKFHSVTDMVQMADEAAKRDGLSSAEALAAIPATFEVDARVAGWRSGV